MLVVIGGVVAAGALVWLWGGVAGALFGGGWPTRRRRSAARGADAPAGAARRSGGPRGRRRRASQLPGTGRVLRRARGARSLAAVGAVTRRRARGRLDRLRRGAAHGRAVGRRRRAADCCGGRDAAARLALGRHRGRLLHAEHRHALVAFGPPQSGKSAGLAIPALLEWDGPAVASSIKTDLLARDAAAGASALGPRVRVRPVRARRRPRPHTWSPLARSRHLGRRARGRVAAGGRGRARSAGRRGRRLLGDRRRAAPGAAAVRGRGDRREASTRVVRWAYGQGTRELHEVARPARRTTPATSASSSDAHAAYDAVRAFEAQADRTRSSIEATAQALLRAYRFARVARVRARGREITADRLLDEPATLYLIGDAKASKLLRPIFLALLSEIVDRAYERATLAGGRLELPLLLCLDEAGNVAPLPNLAEIASTAPSHNIQLVSIFHDLAQARTRYGKPGRDRRQQPPRADAAARRRRSRDAALLRRPASARRRRATTRARPGPAAPRARPRCGAGRWSRPRRCASSRTATRCCSTGGSRRRSVRAADVVRRPSTAEAGAG